MANQVESTAVDAKPLLLRAAFLVLGSCLVALVFNGVRPGGISLAAKNPMADLGENSGPIDLARAKNLFDQGALFIDARSVQEYARGHIRGVLHLYYADFERLGEGLMDPYPLDRIVVTYCSGKDCNASYMLAQDILDLGYERVYVFFGGWPEWEAAGYPSGAAEQSPTPYGAPVSP